MNTAVKRIVLALGWTIYTSQPTPGNFLLGYIFSAVVLLATGLQGESVNLRSPIKQLYYLLLYVVYLSSEVFVSGIKVALIILTPSMPIEPGITAISTQNDTGNSLMSAVSAHGITITPGELVVDFEESRDDGVLMIVHSLDVKNSRQSLDHDQSIQLRRIKRILGHD